MRISASFIIAAFLAACAGSLQATPYFVTTNGNDSANGLGWSTAWLTLTNAVAKAGDGDTITVSNGTYSSAAEISVTENLTITSVNGAANTIVRRSGSHGSYRVFTVNHAFAALDGFTVENGYQTVHATHGGGVQLLAGTVRNCTIRSNQAGSGGSRGGGAYVVNGLLQNCIISGNSTPSHWGGGLYLVSGGIVENCVIRNNTAGVGHVFSSSGQTPYSYYTSPYFQSPGGGVYMAGGTLRNSTVTKNVGLGAGEGVYMTSGTILNCIIYFNGRPGWIWDSENLRQGSGSVTYTCTTPLVTGTGNTNAEPAFVDFDGNDFRLLPGSPCIDTGTDLGAASNDLDGVSRPVDGDGVGVAVTDMGAYEAADATGGVFRCNAVAAVNETTNTLDAQFTAHVAGPDTNSLTYSWDFENDGTPDATGANASHTYSPGWHTVALAVSNASEGVSCTKSNYIRVGSATVYVDSGGSSTFPYETWAKATTDPRTAVDAVYANAGGGTVLVSNGTYNITGHIMLDRAVTVRGVNGAAAAIIRRGGSQHRLFVITHADAVVDGVTITNGYIAGHAATGSGVIMARGLVTHCVIVGNRSPHNATFGGGGVFCRGGGTVRNCLVVGNQNYKEGAGIYGGTVEGCTVVSNSFRDSSLVLLDGDGAGTRNSTVTDSVVYFNYESSGADDVSGGSTAYSCSPGLSGGGNVSADPSFVDADTGDFQLALGSPCIDAGTNLAWMTNAVATDLAGTNRILNATVDMGAYEYVPPATQLAVTNLPPSPVGLTSATMRGGVLHDSFAEDPRCYICWDTSDQGTGSTGAWYRVLDLGTNASATTFGTNVTGLLQGTTYVYRCFVTNSTGEAWASSALSFRTVHVPAVTNLGAVDLTKFGATLRAQLTDDGTDLPDCWFYYWLAGGAATSGVAVGEQSDLFSNTVSSLQPGSNYQYKAFVSNLAGTAWSGVKGFQTVPAVTYYVATNGSDAADGTNWNSAWKTVAYGLTQVTEGDTITLSNGTHLTEAELFVNQRITVRGAFGATNTIVRRSGASGTYRVFSVTHADAVLEQLTIENGVQNPHATHGGGIQMTAGTVRNCVIRNNTAGSGGSQGGGVDISGGLLQSCELYGNHTPGYWGGGVYLHGGVVENCVIRGNTAGTGFSSSGQMPASWNSSPRLQSRAGGVWMTSGAMRNCTITRNVGLGPGEGLYLQGGTVENSIIYFNGRPGWPWDFENILQTGGTITYSCMTPLVAGTGNLDGEPDFVNPEAGDYRLLPGSACIDAGTIIAAVTDDKDGNPRPTDGDGAGGAGYDIGAHEAAAYNGGSFRCNAVASTNQTTDSLNAQFTAYVAGPDTAGLQYWWDLDNNGSVDATGPTASRTYSPGWYTIALTVSNASEGAACTKSNYLRVGSAIAYVTTNGSSTFPYDTWAKAAATPATASAAVYTKDGVATVLVSNGTYNVTSHALLDRAVTVRGLAGAEDTIIRRAGSQHRLFIITHADAMLDGLTITNGYVYGHAAPGAGVVMARGVMQNCIVSGNRAPHPSTFGGGGIMCHGGGTVRNCLVAWNNNYLYGAGIHGGTVENCTVVSNAFRDNAGTLRDGTGAGTRSSALKNSIVYFNYELSGADDVNGGSAAYSCAPGLSGSGNVSGDPLFVDVGTGDWRIRSTSSCADSGTNEAWMATATDLGGRPRISRITVDMGAYEIPPGGTVFLVR